MLGGCGRRCARGAVRTEHEWRVKVHMPILRTEAVRGERVNAELSRAKQVPWEIDAWKRDRGPTDEGGWPQDQKAGHSQHEFEGVRPFPSLG